MLIHVSSSDGQPDVPAEAGLARHSAGSFLERETPALVARPGACEAWRARIQGITRELEAVIGLTTSVLDLAYFSDISEYGKSFDLSCASEPQALLSGTIKASVLLLEKLELEILQSARRSKKNAKKIIHETKLKIGTQKQSLLQLSQAMENLTRVSPRREKRPAGRREAVRDSLDRLVARQTKLAKDMSESSTALRTLRVQDTIRDILWHSRLDNSYSRTLRELLGRDELTMEDCWPRIHLAFLQYQTALENTLSNVPLEAEGQERQGGCQNKIATIANRHKFAFAKLRHLERELELYVNYHRKASRQLSLLAGPIRELKKRMSEGRKLLKAVSLETR